MTTETCLLRQVEPRGRDHSELQLEPAQLQKERAQHGTTFCTVLEFHPPRRTIDHNLKASGSYEFGCKDHGSALHQSIKLVLPGLVVAAAVAQPVESCAAMGRVLGSRPHADKTWKVPGDTRTPPTPQQDKPPAKNMEGAPA